MEPARGTEEYDALTEFCRRNGLAFKKPWLLRRAITHRSYVNEHTAALEDNERLEFLGDAVLDFLVGLWLYHRFPESAEGNLTRLRSALVGNLQLADFSRQIGLGEMMLLGRGEDEGGGRTRSALLGSAFEALVGAIYLDGELPAVQAFMAPLLEQAVEQILAAHRDQDAKSRLQEWSQGQGLGAPEYRTVDSRGPDHAKVFTVEVLISGKVYGVGEGYSKQTAAKAAARQALIALGQD